MVIESLKLLDFRAHAESLVHFRPGLNFLHGPNGAGKTNSLEAIHYVAMSKSFLTASDSYAIRNGCRSFEVEGRFRSDSGKRITVHIGYSREEGKRILVNKAPLDRLVDIVGSVPVVTFSPLDIALTADGPDVRRRFLDNTLSQARPAYLADLLKYRRALRQRNALLAGAKQFGRVDQAMLESWTEELLSVAIRIGFARGKFVSSFQGYLDRAFSTFDALGEESAMRYRWAKDGENASMEEVEEGLREAHARVGDRESVVGRTMFGPHLDEITFMLNNLPVRQYASRGQHRTFALALKLATFFYLKDRLDENPILLLDDVFAELDNHRSRVLADMLGTDQMGQSVITIAELEAILPHVSFNPARDGVIRIESGSVVETPGPVTYTQ